VAQELRLDWHTVKALEPVGVKCVAVVSTAGDPRAALAVEPDDRPVDAGVQLAALAVVQVEASSSVSRLTGGRIPRGAGVGEGAAVRVGRDDAQGADGTTLIRLCQGSSSTVQSFCFTFSHRLVGPPSYGLVSSFAIMPS
jgi:hypothetical protein